MDTGVSGRRGHRAACRVVMVSSAGGVTVTVLRRQATVYRVQVIRCRLYTATTLIAIHSRLLVFGVYGHRGVVVLHRVDWVMRIARVPAAQVRCAGVGPIRNSRA